jgi:hypothetical protein
MERRRFLVLGSAAAVAFAARGVSAAVATSPAAAELPTFLSVAFVDGLDRRASAFGGASIVGGDSMTAGDPGFISRSAKVAVLGMWRSQNRRSAVGLALKAYYPTAPYMNGDVPYFAWSHISRSTSDRQHQTHFRIPIDEAGLRLEIETAVPRGNSALAEAIRNRVTTNDQDSRPRARAALAQLKNVAALSIGVDRGSSKLRPGTYVLALMPAGVATPNWSNVRYTPANMNTGSGPLSVRGVLGETPAPFDYVVVDVDFAQ